MVTESAGFVKDQIYYTFSGDLNLLPHEHETEINPC